MNFEVPLQHAAVIEALPVALMAFGPDRRLRLTNSAMSSLLDLDVPGEALGLELDQVIRHLAYRGVLGDGAPEARAQAILGLDLTLPARRLLRGVDHRVHEWRSTPLPNGGMAVLLEESTAQIQARDRAETELRDLQALLARLGTGIAQYDGEQRLRYGNPAYVELVGLTPGEMRPGIELRELLEGQVARGEYDLVQLDRIVTEITAKCSRGMRWASERTRPNGRTVRFQNQPLPDGGWLTEAADITEKHDNEQEARRRADLQGALLAALPVGVAVYGPDRKLILVNEAYNRLYADSPISPGENLRDILLRRARAGEYGPGEPEAHVEMRLARLRQPQVFERQLSDGSLTIFRSVPLPNGGHAMVLSDVSALQAAKAEARERAQVLHTMLESTRHGIALFDREHRVIAANRLAAEFCGLPVSAFSPGTHMDELRRRQREQGAYGNPQDAEGFLEAHGQKSLRGADRYTRTDAQGRTIEVVTDALPDGSFVRSYTDVTPLVRAQEEAKGRAAMLQEVLDTMRHGIIMYDSEGRVRVGNKLAERLAGFPDGSVAPGAHYQDLRDMQIHAGEIAPEPEAQRYPADTTAPWTTESTYQRHRPDGTVLEVRTDRTPVGGSVRSFTDVTALARAEAEAASRAAMMQAMLDNIRHGIALFDTQSRLIAFNRVCASLMGLEGVLRLGLSHQELIQAQADRGEFGDAAETAAFCDRLRKEDWTRPRSLRRRRPNGTELEAVSGPVPDGGYVLTLTDITGRIEAERQAERRAALLEATLNAARTGIALYGPDHRVIAANNLAARIAGWDSGAKMVGHSLDEVLRHQCIFEAGGDEAAAADTLRLQAKADRSLPIHYQRRRSDGRVLDVNSDPTPDGGFAISVSDVTPLVDAQEEAQRRSGILQVMINNSRQAVLLYDREKRLVAGNRLAGELFSLRDVENRAGTPLADLLAEQFTQGPHGQGVEGEREVRMFLELDRTKPLRFTRTTPAGRVLAVSSDPTPDGGFVVSASDVTALARAEAEAQRRAEILSVMLGNIRHGIILFDAEGRIVASNSTLQDMLRLSPGALAPGRTQAEMVDALLEAGEYGTGEEARAIADSIKGRDRRQHIRASRRRPDGGIFEVVSDPTPDGGWVVTYTDVTEDRHIRAELERARMAAEAASLAKSRFLATMSHELRTPLNAVIGFSEALREDVPKDHITEFAGAIQDAGRHLLSLIDDILDITRAEEGGLPVAVERVETWPLLRRVVRMMLNQAEAARVRVLLDAEEGLPALRGDAQRLRQILLNLISNAIKFTPAEGTITVGAAHDDDGGLSIVVRDSGIGISAEDMPRLFQPFAQVDSALSRRYTGSGLGLYLCRVLAEAQGATLSMDSTPGEGTTVRLRFPPSSILD